MNILVPVRSCVRQISGIHGEGQTRRMVLPLAVRSQQSGTQEKTRKDTSYYHQLSAAGKTHASQQRSSHSGRNRARGTAATYNLPVTPVGFPHARYSHRAPREGLSLSTAGSAPIARAERAQHKFLWREAQRLLLGRVPKLLM